MPRAVLAEPDPQSEPTFDDKKQRSDLASMCQAACLVVALLKLKMHAEPAVLSCSEPAWPAVLSDMQPAVLNLKVPAEPAALSYVQPAVLSCFESAKPAVLTVSTEALVLAKKALTLVPLFQVPELTALTVVVTLLLVLLMKTVCIVLLFHMPDLPVLAV